jgi:DNA excision repair protein ERCC-8
MFFPSDSGEIFMFRAVDGKIVKRLNRGSPTAARSACIVARGDSSLQFYSGGLDGSITAWVPTFIEQDDLSDSDVEDEPKVLDDIWRSIAF